MCNRPKDNGSCTVLPRIAEEKDEECEGQQHVRGKRVDKLEANELPPCMQERATFMAPFTVSRHLVHPYKDISNAHRELLPTTLQQGPFSAACIPFRWMRKEYADELAQGWRIDYDRQREPTEPQWLAESNWVQNGLNQRAMLEGFFSTIRRNVSLCFFYAKQTPYSDAMRRVIVGVGRVLKVGDPVQYERAGTGSDVETPYLWDVLIEHSIRPEDGDGFLMPYAQLLAAEEHGAAVDWNKCLAFAPAERVVEFSYAAEHVTQDGAISALLECRTALEAARGVLHKADQSDAAAQALRWIDSRIAELWTLRGAYPGLGAALSAFGVQHGNFLALHLAEHLKENEDPWPLVDKVMRKPASLPTSLASLVARDLSDVWKGLRPERLQLLKLLARFALTNDQAERFYVKAMREASGLQYDDSQLLENPYLIYEADRFSVPMGEKRLERITLETIDRGAYPAEVVGTKHPLPLTSRMTGPLDKRRVRALTIAQLEHGALNGHTLVPQDHAILGIRNAKLEPPCPVTEDVLDATADFFSYEVKRVLMKNDRPGLQLGRYVGFKSLLSTQIDNRVNKSQRFQFVNDWRIRLDDLLPKLDDSDADELRARNEKSAALAELAASRFSVLVGPAGAGKTTVLRALCKHEQISARGVLLLAPTGKARVQLSQKCGQEAQTLAQFLVTCGGRYNGRTGTYKTTVGSPYEGCKTIIVDEASMLTEDMLGALFDAIKGTVERIILVGDPRQLPPIGAGRPFFDAVTFLTPESMPAGAPRVAKGYAELTIQRRHKRSGEAESFPVDLQLANWFSGRPLPPGEDEIWSVLGGAGDLTGRVATHRWDTTDELRETLLEVLRTELGLKSKDDDTTFATSYGGVLNGEGNVRFKAGAAQSAEAWQILTPLRNEILGARDINRLLHKTFRKSAVDWAHRSASGKGHRARTTPARGQEEIVYGDKVINIRNHRREYVSPLAGALQYISNGEIGVVVGEVQAANAGNQAPWRTKVEFSSQPDFVYSFSKQDFDEEANPLLELAYAVTVHKAQGSEFGITILVLPQKHRIVSREMLYTALTRQQERVVVLHQGELSQLRRLATDENAVIPQRFTNLFEKQRPTALPSPVEVNGKWLDERLIHRSRRGTALRSKSEVIIDDALLAHSIDASYETPFFGKDGRQRLPDFTIQDQSMGRTILWEHCGMMADEGYAKRWEHKLAWYRENGVLPHEEGGGTVATLVVTYDNERGGIDSQRIDALIEEIFG